MRRNALFWMALTTLLVLALLTIIFPKTVYEELGEGEAKACGCYGSEFWFGTRCIGFARDCEIIPTGTASQACRELTCAEIFDRLYDENRILSQQLKAKAGTDVILIMDSSNSMEGDKLSAAKEAARRLVGNLQEGERISIISFSENSSVVHKFSDDQESLRQGISSITVSGGTNYLPALGAAEELFREQRRSAKRGIIFLSDGIPSDDQERILNKTRALREDGISIFTISFDIAEDEAATSILESMVAAGESEDSAERWYREFTEAQSIADAFNEAWEEISNLDIITITPTFDEESFPAATWAGEGFHVMLDSLFLTQSQQDDSLCVPQLETSVSLNGTNGSRSYSLVPAGRRHLFPEDALVPGTYNVSVEARLHSNHNGSCFFSGSLQVPRLVVEEPRGPCREPSCAEAREVLEDFDLAAERGATLPRSSGYGRVAILLDSSESMREELSDVLRGADRLNRLLSLGDERALVVFSEEASLRVPFTRDKDDFSASLGGVVPQGTTRLVPALVKAGFLFGEPQDDDIVVVLTDGITHDERGGAGIREEASSLVDSGVCLFVIGYGSELLRDEEQVSLLRGVASYSQRSLGCGSFVPAPDSEALSSLVTSMFGGDRSDEDMIRVFFDPAPSSRGGVVSFTARAVSMATGLHLPVSHHGLCVPAPVINVSLVRRGGEELPLTTYRYADGSVHAQSSYLFPGRYVARAQARLPVDGCGSVHSFEQEVVVLGPPADSNDQVITAAIVALCAAIFFLARVVRKKW